MKDKITFFYGQLDPTHEHHWLPLCFPLLSSYLDLDKIEVIVIDERIEKENTLKLIDEHAPQSIFLGISSFTGYQLLRSIEIAKYIKNKFPNLPIVWGGSHVTALPEESMREDFVDIVVANRGESVLPLLIKGLKENSLGNIPGIFYKKGKNIVKNPDAPIRDFDSTPRWPYEILKIHKYLNPKTMAVNLTTSWGCSNRCTFCFWHKSHNPWSAFSAKRVVETVRYFKERYGVRQIWFNESDYFLDTGRVFEIAELLKPLNMRYTATARVDDLTRISSEQFKFLEESGLYAIFIGLESGSPRILKLMNKKINLEDLMLTARNTRSTKITLFLSLLFQIPNETIEDVKMTYDYVEALRKINPNTRRQTCSFTPLPNLPLTRLAAKMGFNVPQSMSEWVKIIKKSSFEKKPWLSDEYAQKYQMIFKELFSKSQIMIYDSYDSSEEKKKHSFV